MRRLVFVIVAAAVSACAPPSTPLETPAPAPTDAAVPAADLGPYANQWDSNAFVRFNHTLRAAAPGRHTVALEATTPGTQTVALYPADANGERNGGRLLFVVATTSGTRETTELDIPEAGRPVVVVVENASGRQSTGSYSITLTPSAAE